MKTGKTLHNLTPNDYKIPESFVQSTEQKKTKIFSLNLLTYCLQYDIIYTGGEEKMPKRKKKKATAIEIADIVIKAVVAVAALITAISQWK